MKAQNPRAIVVNGKVNRIWYEEACLLTGAHQYADRQGVTEQLKAENQLEWVGKMNNIRSRAVEIIDVELICVQEDKAADIMLKVVACARILMYNTF